VSLSPDREPHILAGSGRIDALTAPQLDEQLKALHASGARTIVFDMANVAYISSSGLRVLLLAVRRQQTAGGSFILRNVPERIMRVLRIAGFDRLFPIEGAPPLSGAAHDA